jgi:hypothetical protein
MNNDVGKYNDRMYYGFLAFFTAAAGALVYILN